MLFRFQLEAAGLLGTRLAMLVINRWNWEVIGDRSAAEIGGDIGDWSARIQSLEINMFNEKQIVAVTGSSGMIGSKVVERLASDFVVIGIDRPGLPHPSPAAKCVEIDLADDASVVHGLRSIRETYESLASVVHLAAYYDFSGEPSSKYDEITVRGTNRLFKGLVDFHVEQFIFASSMLVHAPCQPGERIDESWPIEPKWDYPKSKVDTELLLHQVHDGVKIVFLRIAGVYNDRCQSIPLAHQIDRINQRTMTSHVYPGDLACGQSFVHLDDVVDAIQRTVERRADLPSEIAMLIGEPETLSYDELQREFGRLIHGEDWTTQSIPKVVAKAGAWIQDVVPGSDEENFIKPWMIDLADDHYALDIKRARTMIGWQPRHKLRDALPKMIAALKKDESQWYRDNKLPIPETIKDAKE